MGDLISRQAALDAINHICPVDTEYDCTLLDRVDVRFVLSELPSAQPERPKGEWIHIRDEEDGNALYECSVCHKGEVHVPIVEVSYCWNCGADMRGEQDG